MPSLSYSILCTLRALLYSLSYQGWTLLLHITESADDGMTIVRTRVLRPQCQPEDTTREGESQAAGREGVGGGREGCACACQAVGTRCGYKEERRWRLEPGVPQAGMRRRRGKQPGQGEGAEGSRKGGGGTVGHGCATPKASQSAGTLDFPRVEAGSQRLRARGSPNGGTEAVDRDLSAGEGYMGSEDGVLTAQGRSIAPTRPVSIVGSSSLSATGKDRKPSDDFKQTALYDHWQKFLTAAEERLKALAKYESPLFEARKACDNEEESSRLKRCSGCQAINAPGTANEMTGKSGTGTLVAPTTAYFSVLSEYDPAVRIPDALFTLFDYCKSPPVVTVYPVDPEDEEAQERLHDLVDTESDEWEDLVQRAMVGKGRYQLHGIRVLEGDTMRTWVVPLRTDGEGLFDGSVRLSQQLRRGSLAKGQLNGEIEVLLQSTEGIVEIH
ncbi:hypothetical protein FB45DRAFT_1121516 [Roridomyces roridus]|uniref:Uncharacterized protein n=1 Tax=Roridomyces roridus TaxID=1738132 RepID=A0AAD7B5D1_9AGAR|nr:hypothetical protein FB45DRAFT_1121516 [Roridomyces roridus]